jgi:hypothetical protein
MLGGAAEAGCQAVPGAMPGEHEHVDGHKACERKQ